MNTNDNMPPSSLGSGTSESTDLFAPGDDSSDDSVLVWYPHQPVSDAERSAIEWRVTMKHRGRLSTPGLLEPNARLCPTCGANGSVDRSSTTTSYLCENPRCLADPKDRTWPAPSEEEMRWFCRYDKLAAPWIIAACDEHRGVLLENGFLPGHWKPSSPPSAPEECALCEDPALWGRVERCTCIDAPTDCTEHKPGQ